MSVHDVGQALVVSTGFLVSDSVGVASLSRCRGIIGGIVPFARLGCMLPNTEGSDIFVRHLAKKSVRVMALLGVVVASVGRASSPRLFVWVVGLLLSIRGPRCS